MIVRKTLLPTLLNNTHQSEIKAATRVMKMHTETKTLHYFKESVLFVKVVLYHYILA